MSWTPDKSRPICPQLCEMICVAIASGEFAAGERLPSVREIALKAGVNPNTVQKSFDELERRGVIHSVPCSGWYVNEEIDAAIEELRSIKEKKTRAYLAEMSQLGCDLENIIKYLKECQEGM